MRLFIAIPFSEEFKGELIRVQNEMRRNGVRMNVDRVCLMKSERVNGKLTYTVVGEARR